MKVRGVSNARHAARYREIATVLTEEGLSAAAISFGLPGAKRRAERDLPDSTIPERIRRSLERLGPTAVKVGQMLSTRPDLIPEQYRIELRRLQDEVAPISYDEVAEVIDEELGAPPLRIFANFEREPLASASIGQVHTAILKTGETAVVKVQRPGVRARVETDLDIVRVQARRLGDSGLVPAYVRTHDIAEEFSEAVRRELDYLEEADNIEVFRRLLSDSTDVCIPRVFREYTTHRVLTLSRVNGIPFNRLSLIDEAGLDRQELAARGVRAYLTMIFRLGMYHADPHPGNLFALDDQRIGFTDFGRIGHVQPGVRDVAADLLMAIVDRDADLAADAIVEASYNPGLIDLSTLEREMSALIGKYYGTQIGQVRVGEMIEDLLELVRRQQLSLPSSLVMMLATMAVLEGVGRDLDPTFDFVRIAEPFVRELTREQYSPDELARRGTRTLRRLGRTVSSMPASVDHALRRVGEGEFHVNLRPEGYEAFVARVEELVDRLSFSLLIAAFVVGFSLLLTNESLPRWVEIIAMVGMLGAVGVSTWMFVSIYVSRWRGHG